MWIVTRPCDSTGDEDFVLVVLNKHSYICSKVKKIHGLQKYFAVRGQRFKLLINTY